jgi:predicted nucleotidyltransferase
VSNPDLKFEKKYEKIVKQKVLELFGKTSARIFLFGSRARGDNRRGSDFDIGIEAVDSETFRKLVLDFDQFWEESIVPGKVDFVYLDDATAEFRKEVKKDGILWKDD